MYNFVVTLVITGGLALFHYWEICSDSKDFNFKWTTITRCGNFIIYTNWVQKGESGP